MKEKKEQISFESYRIRICG